MSQLVQGRFHTDMSPSDTAARRRGAEGAPSTTHPRVCEVYYVCDLTPNLSQALSPAISLVKVIASSVSFPDGFVYYFVLCSVLSGGLLICCGCKV